MFWLSAYYLSICLSLSLSFEEEEKFFGFELSQDFYSMT